MNYEINIKRNAINAMKLKILMNLKNIKEFAEIVY